MNMRKFLSVHDNYPHRKTKICQIDMLQQGIGSVLVKKLLICRVREE